MGETTKIAWTDHTFNPWWGCEKVSPGCAHCYAETFADRLGMGDGIEGRDGSRTNPLWGPDHGFRFFFGDRHWAEPLKWNKLAEAEGRRHRVFCASMADVFEDRVELDWPRARLFDLINATPWLDWQVLTKRAREMRDHIDRITAVDVGYPGGTSHSLIQNLWLGVSVETAKQIDRVDYLRQTPAKVRFISAEPLLGPLVKECRHLERTTSAPFCPDCHGTGLEGLDLTGIDWVIIGGESGPGHRPMETKWAIDLIDKADREFAAVFVKQAGGPKPGLQGDLPDWAWAKREFPR